MGYRLFVQSAQRIQVVLIPVRLMSLVPIRLFPLSLKQRSLDIRYGNAGQSLGKVYTVGGRHVLERHPLGRACKAGWAVGTRQLVLANHGDRQPRVDRTQNVCHTAKPLSDIGVVHTLLGPLPHPRVAVIVGATVAGKGTGRVVAQGCDGEAR